MAKKSKKARAPASGDVATNRRARHRFQLLEKMEAGIELHGSEVKSLREGKAQLNEAYAVVERGEVWLRGAHIPPTCPPPTRIATPTGRASSSSIAGRSSDWWARPPSGD